MSRPLADRALRIMDALLTEVESRGYTVEPQTDLQRGEAVHTLAIVIRGPTFPLVLTERTAKVPYELTWQELRRKEHNLGVWGPGHWLDRSASLDRCRAC
ncbi:hypothetical protein [Streptomyces sp. NPDC020742]|uniref:hypothetical protein n=1 Tax=Streptomyces sp. NPDC020742 TaxID=3154897 RepID=UPI0033D5EA63